MADPLSPERLAELRRIATGEDWSPPQREDVAALIGEIDRVTAERDRLLRALEAVSWRFTAAAQLPYQFENLAVTSAHPQTAAAFRAVANLIRATIHPEDADPEPRRDAEPPGAASAQSEPSEPKFVAQRPAEGFEWEYGYQNMDRKIDKTPMMIGRSLQDIAAAMRRHREYAPEMHYALRRRPVGPWETTEDESVLPVDLSGELDDFAPEQLAELKRISGEPGAPLSVPCGHPPHLLVLGDDGVGCMVCGPAKAETIAPEDEGVSSADVTAQQAADERNR